MPTALRVPSHTFFKLLDKALSTLASTSDFVTLQLRARKFSSNHARALRAADLRAIRAILSAKRKGQNAATTDNAFFANLR